MKPLKCRNWIGRIQSLIPPAVIISTFAALCLLTQAPVWAAGTVTSCSETSLRNAMAGGGTVTFACDGTITLANTISNPPPSRFPSFKTNNVVLDGTGHQITISGGNNVRVFYVGTNNTLGLVNLTLANGLSTNGGGAICVQTGTVCATNCTFMGNTAMPGTNFASQLLNDAQGGAIRNEGGYVNLQNCLFTSNSAVPVLIGIFSYGNGAGGAIFNTGSLIMDSCQFVQNWAAGGDPAPGNPDTGWACGGAIYNEGNAVIGRSSFISNSAAGGRGLPGSDGHGVTPPGPGGDGGDAYGSAIYSGGTLLLVNCTVAVNTAIAGSGGLGGQGYPFRGQDGANGSAYGAICGGNLVNDTVALNSGGGCGGGVNTLLFSNTPDKNDTFADPKLGPLADNGGPTLTMALLPGSPAIDAGSAVGAPATDQRGIYRPQGPGVDIGAFEYQYNPVITGATIQYGTNRQMQLCVLTSNLNLTLQVSTNLLNWRDVTNFLAGSNGVFQCVDAVSGDAQARFYRLKSGIP
jgi:hypothetical protein